MLIPIIYGICITYTTVIVTTLYVINLHVFIQAMLILIKFKFIIFFGIIGRMLAPFKCHIMDRKTHLILDLAFIHNKSHLFVLFHLERTILMDILQGKC